MIAKRLQIRIAADPFPIAESNPEGFFQAVHGFLLQTFQRIETRHIIPHTGILYIQG